MKLIGFVATVLAATSTLSACGGGGGGGGSTGALKVTGAPATQAVVGVSYSFLPQTSGAQGTLTFSIDGKPAWLTFNATTGSVTGTPASADVGMTAPVTISVSDGKSSASLAPFSITVASNQDTTFVPKVSPCSGALQGTHMTYDVGPGKTYADLSTVPFLSLQAGDVVNIYYRPDPYRTNVALKAQGTAQDPVIINGVTDENCNRPIISGENATNAMDQASGYHDSYSKGLGVILVWWGAGKYGNVPRFITIQNLAVTKAPMAVAGIYAVTVDDFTVQNCEIYDNQGWGIFTNVKNESDIETTHRVTIRGNRLYGNGVDGSYIHHNLYIQSYRALYEGNFIGQLRPGAQGSSMKDRSSGTVIRYNLIYSAARAIDLVETEEGMTTVGADPLYNDAWVYGNTIVNDDSMPGVASISNIHWGFDNTLAHARKGTLHFYNNTYVSKTKATGYKGYTALFDMQSPSADNVDPHCTVEVQNNVLWQSGNTFLAMARNFGTVNFTGTNWISTGWSNGDAHLVTPQVVVNKVGTLIEGDSPGIDANYVPMAGSPVIGAATGDTPTGVAYEYHAGTGVIERDTADDLGAFEH